VVSKASTASTTSPAQRGLISDTALARTPISANIIRTLSLDGPPPVQHSLATRPTSSVVKSSRPLTIHASPSHAKTHTTIIGGTNRARHLISSQPSPIPPGASPTVPTRVLPNNTDSVILRASSSTAPIAATTPTPPSQMTRPIMVSGNNTTSTTISMQNLDATGVGRNDPRPSHHSHLILDRDDAIADVSPPATAATVLSTLDSAQPLSRPPPK
jgi:hypothetical protein